MYKEPLTIHILWHEKFEEGTNFAEYIFKKLNRDPDNINFRDIGIPVIFKNLSKNDTHINYDKTDRTFIVILVDDYMVMDKEWGNYINLISEKVKTSNNIHLLPVAMNSNSFNLNIGSKNYIRLHDVETFESIFKNSENLRDNLEFKKEFLLSELSHEIARELINPDNKAPLKLFLSHAKSDGVNITRILKKYIETFTKSKTFFDANDIEIGKEFWERIEKNIETSFLVIIQSDQYSNSMWCRKEILAAKKHNRPILCINSIEKEENRSFPYMANIKNIRLTEKSSFKDFYHVITEIYIEAIRNKFNQLKMEVFVKNNNIDSKIIINSPELLDFVENKDFTEDLIIYPDPPLSEEEIELFDNSKKYLTPLTYITKHKRILENKKISFSISEESMKQKKVKFYMLKDIMNELIRYIFYYGGNIYYGGDLKYDVKDNYNLLKSMINVLEAYNKTADKNDKEIVNYVAYPLTENLSISDEAKYKKIVKFEKIIPNDFKTDLTDIEKNNIFCLNKIEDLEKWCISLSTMRENLLKKVDAVVIMGGKTIGYKGCYPGVLEEFLIAKDNKKPIYILGGFGGTSKEIINLIKGKDSEKLSELYQLENNNEHYKNYYNQKIELKYEAICSQIKNDEINQLNNGLTDEENKVLFESENAYEIMNLIIKGLANIF